MRAHLEKRRRDAVLAQPRNDVDDEKGRPAEEEDAHDDADRNGRLVLQVQRRLGRVRRRRRCRRGRRPPAILPGSLSPQSPCLHRLT